MLGRSPILLHHIAWEIDYYQTWYNFALVSKKCSQAAKYFTKSKKRDFSHPRVIDSVQFHVLPNGWIHGPIDVDVQWAVSRHGYYIDGCPSQTALWPGKPSSDNKLIRKTVMKHLIITERNDQFTLIRITPEQISGKIILGLKCPNCGWMHIIRTWTKNNIGLVKHVFIMTQRCGDKSYQKLVIKNINIVYINRVKWFHFRRYCKKHPTGFHFQDIPAYFKK